MPDWAGTRNQRAKTQGESVVTDGRPRIELYLRSLAPAQGRRQQETVVERLRALDTDDRIRGFDVVLCGECVCPQSATAETDPGRRLLDSYERFADWADRTDRELVGFSRRDTTSLLTGTEVTGIVFPRVVLAEYRDGALSYVAPSAGDEQTSVRERLETYRA